VVSKDVGAGKNGAKAQASQKYSPAQPRLKCRTNVCELEDYVGEKGWNLNWLTKLRPIKKPPFAS